MTPNFYTIETRSIEWVYVITKLVSSHKPSVEDVSIGMENGFTVYYIRKSLIPPAELATALGSDETTVNEAKRLVLKPLADETGLPKPTVPYVGEA